MLLCITSNLTNSSCFNRIVFMLLQARSNLFKLLKFLKDSRKRKDFIFFKSCILKIKTAININ